MIFTIITVELENVELVSHLHISRTKFPQYDGLRTHAFEYQSLRTSGAHIGRRAKGIMGKILQTNQYVSLFGTIFSYSLSSQRDFLQCFILRTLRSFLKHLSPNAIL